MKNKITLLGCLFFAFGIADAAEFTGTYNNDGGHRTTLSGLSKNIDAVLNSTPNEAADSGINYRGGSQTMKSMTVVDRTSTPEVAGDANIAGNFTIDTNSAGAYQGLSVNNMTLVASNVVVKNSLSSTAAVNLNFGQLVLNGDATQTQTLTFNGVSANVSTANTTIIGQTANTTSKIIIDSASNVNWSGNIYSGVRGATFPADSGLAVNGVLNMDGDIAVYGYASIGSGGVLNMNGKTLSMTGTLTVAGTLNFVGDSGTQSDRFYHYGTLLLTNTSPSSQFTIYNIDSGYSGAATLTQSVAEGDNTGIRIKGTANISYGSTWTVNEKLELAGRSNGTAKLNIDAKSSSVKITVGENQEARFGLLGNSVATLKTENAVTMDDGSSVKLFVDESSSSLANKLVLDASQKFKKIELNGNLEITLAATAVLSLDDDSEATISIAEGKYLTIYNFRDDAVYVGGNLDVSVLSQIKAYNSESELQNLVVNEGWLQAQAVPEPAEWAAIFGAFALALAFRRRRK